MKNQTQSRGTEGIGFSAMKKALRKDPRALQTILSSRREDLALAYSEALDSGNASYADELSETLDKVDATLERLEDKLIKELSANSGFSLQPSKMEPATAPDQNNPVAMNMRLRREVGNHAADFLDEYAQAIYDRIFGLLEEIKTKALELGVEDSTDGETSLREALRDQIGRRGLVAVEPVFNEWRAGIFKAIAKELKSMFVEEDTEVVLKDEQIGTLLGLDSLDEGMSDEEASVEMEASEEEAVEEQTEASEEETSEEEASVEMEASEEEEAVEEGATEAETSASLAPISIARGPISVRIGGQIKASAPVSASVQKASDFIPSSHTTPRLD